MMHMNDNKVVYGVNDNVENNPKADDTAGKERTKDKRYLTVTML